MTAPTPKAIEAASRVIWNDRAEELNGPKWDDLTPAQRNRTFGLYVEHIATAVLSAAYPLMVAQAKAEALREAAAYHKEHIRFYGDTEGQIADWNTGKDHASHSDWLLTRAASIKAGVAL